MASKFTTLADAADLFKRDRSSLRRAAVKLGIVGTLVRAPSGQMVLAYNADQMRLLRARFPTKLVLKGEK
jgi:hypothetical protein